MAFACRIVGEGRGPEERLPINLCFAVVASFANPFGPRSLVGVLYSGDRRLFVRTAFGTLGRTKDVGFRGGIIGTACIWL